MPTTKPTKRTPAKRTRRLAPDPEADCCDCVAHEPEPVPPYVARTAAGRRVDEGKDPQALARRCEDRRYDAGAVDVAISDSRGRIVCVVQKNGGAYWLP
jgi:hypothetical protein